MAGSGIRAALGVLLACAFVSWIISLIGIAGLQRFCWSMPTLGAEGIGTSLPQIGIRGFNRSFSCYEIYRYYWFMFAFEFIALMGLTIMAAAGMLAASALSWMAWLVVLTALHIQGADSFLALQDITWRLVGTGPGSWENYNYARLTAAGWILTAMCNVGLIFLLGWRPRKLRASVAGGPMKY